MKSAFKNIKPVTGLCNFIITNLPVHNLSGDINYIILILVLCEIDKTNTPSDFQFRSTTYETINYLPEITILKIKYVYHSDVKLCSISMG